MSLQGMSIAPPQTRIYIPPTHIHTHNLPSSSSSSSSLLELCTSLKEVHQFISPIIKHGMYTQPTFQSKLISLFCTYNSLHEAAKVFEPVAPKPDILYHTLLKGYAKDSSFSCFDNAFTFFVRMLCDGVSPVVYDFAYLLKLCGECSEIVKGREIHGMLVSNGFASNSVLMGSVVNMYAKCKQVKDAYKVFGKMKERNLMSWNNIIAGHAQNGLPRMALELVFLMMQEAERLRPDSIMVVTMLPAAGDVGDLRVGKSIHGYVMRAGFGSLVYILTGLVDMYGKCGLVGTARVIFDRMGEKNVVSWNSMINGYVRSGNYQEAVGIFDKMLDGKMELTDVTIMEALRACAGLGDLERGLFIHKLVDELKLHNSVSVMNSLISMYSKCRMVDIAADIFLNLKGKKNRVSWNAIILGFAQNGCAYDALKYFSQMRAQNIKPDSFTMVSVIIATAGLLDSQCSRWIHALVIRSSFHMNVYMITALIDMYAKCGDVRNARTLLNMIGKTKKQVTAWNAMIDGYDMHRYGNFDIEFLANKVSDLKPGVVGDQVALSNMYATEETNEILKTPCSTYLKSETIYTFLEILEDKIKTDNYVHDTHPVHHVENVSQ